MPPAEPADPPDPADPTDPAVFEQVRSAAAKVAGSARAVHLDEHGIEQLARRLATLIPVTTDKANDNATDNAEAEPSPYRRVDIDSTVSFIVTFDAINFGSGWFPSLRKRVAADGSGRMLSGARTLTANLADWFDRHGAWTCKELSRLVADDLAVALGQVDAGFAAEELMTQMAMALRELGDFVGRTVDGSLRALVESARGDAASLVATLIQMPSFRDIAVYDRRPVPFLKRAQITVADIHRTLGPHAPFGFDVHRLTMFADNLVPHVLRVDGALRYDAALLTRIEREVLLVPGSAEEVEIRACAVHVVELLRVQLHQLGRTDVTSMAIDEALWARGQEPAFKAVPRHRCRCLFY